MSDDEDDVRPTPNGAPDDDDDSVLPAFIGKLLKMMTDPECSDIILYGSDGNTLLVTDSVLFATVGA